MTRAKWTFALALLMEWWIFLEYLGHAIVNLCA